jgi:SpoVK/Ycf46/Vps4 family AAA+-type ATPase
VLHVHSPSLDEQYKIMDHFLKAYGIQGSFELVTTLKEKLRIGISGAEVENLCREAAFRLLL